MTTFLLIRHGETDWNAAGRWQGHADIPLNKRGQQQAKALAARLAGQPISAIISSDLQRTAQTAVPLATAHNLPIIHDPIWRERDVGQFSGLTTAEIIEQLPEVWEARVNGVMNPPGGELYEQFHERAARAFAGLTAVYKNGETVAIISHGGTLGAVISHVLGIPPTQHPRFSLRGNTGISTIEVGEHGTRLLGLNDTCHLNHL